MQNTGMAQFSYEVFKSAYDGDPNIKSLVKNFDRNNIELHSEMGVDTLDVDDTQPDPNSGEVAKMAKRATKI